MIEVSCAIIRNNFEILAVRRGPESSHPMKWEFPGGKVHPGETAEHCIIREIKEELIVDIEVVVRLTPIEFDYGTMPTIRLIPFICRITLGQIVLTEHMAQCWFHPDNWRAFDWLDADYELILKNMDGIKACFF
jgi:8-oxo-dGTP diphosphatase